jgi:hypothetical protein
MYVIAKEIVILLFMSFFLFCGGGGGGGGAGGANRFMLFCHFWHIFLNTFKPNVRWFNICYQLILICVRG